MVADWVKQEDENKWRCTECKKLFKAGSFVEKHVINKHPEHCKGRLDEVCLHIIIVVSL
jgi:ribosomal protein L37AE/L43A